LSPSPGRSGINLTKAGEVLYRDYKKVLASYKVIREERLQGYGRGSFICGIVKVASVYSVGLYELPPKLCEYLKKYASAKIDLEYSGPAQVIRGVLSREVEIDLVAFPEPNAVLTIVPMAAGRMVLVCPPGHEFAGRRRINNQLRDLITVSICYRVKSIIP
jgi:LysR family transcriptional regulator, transcriptional activator of the cysJI operon